MTGAPTWAKSGRRSSGMPRPVASLQAHHLPCASTALEARSSCPRASGCAGSKLETLCLAGRCVSTRGQKTTVAAHHLCHTLNHKRRV
eukprot:11707783-Alexandrium_andersonii.AAC.1